MRAGARVQPPAVPFRGGPLLQVLARNWLLILFRGACAIGFGLFCFVRPGATLRMLVMLYGAYAIFDGVFALLAGLSGGAGLPRIGLAVAGVAGVAAGVAVMVAPFVVMITLLILISCWAIALGIVEILAAARLRHQTSDAWMAAAAGAASIAFGLIPALEPMAGPSGLSVVIGVFAVVHGVLLITVALSLSGRSQEEE
jgi:uncharacterized membrane protein HdeD (DUF308 family)